MAGKNSKPGGDEGLEKAWQNYCLLDKEVKLWQEERGKYWNELLQPKDAPPYFPIANFAEAMVFELWGRLNNAAKSSASETVMRESWQAFRSGKQIPDEELMSSLMIVLKGIAQLCRAKSDSGHELDISANSDVSICPICGEKTGLSLLKPPEGKRFLHCIMCGYEWPVMRSSCICCGNQEHLKQNYLNTKEFPGVEVVACDACGQYFKEFDLRVLAAGDFMWEDMRTLPLNYAAEQWLAEKAQKNGTVQ